MSAEHPNRLCRADLTRRFLFLGCEVLFREVCWLSARAPHTIDHRWMSQGLHDLGAEKMSARLQEELDAVPPGRYEAILLGFGLCNNGVVGLSSPAHRLVIPKAHDCITFFLGSRERYRRVFDENPGTYFLTSGWLERDDENLFDAGAGVTDTLGLGMRREEIIARYGEENAAFLLETLGEMTAHYSRIAYLSIEFDEGLPFRTEAERIAHEKGWEFQDLAADLSLLERMLHGEWGEEFLVVEPGERIEATHDEAVLGCRGCARTAPEEP